MKVKRSKPHCRRYWTKRLPLWKYEKYSIPEPFSMSAPITSSVKQSLLVNVREKHASQGYRAILTLISDTDEKAVGLL